MRYFSHTRQPALLNPQAQDWHTDPVSHEPSPISAPQSGSASPAPLTLENLQNIGRVVRAQAATNQSQASSTPKSTSIMGPKSEAKQPTTVTAVRQALKDHRYFFEDLEAEQRGAALIAVARGIIHGERGSSINANELTFLINFWAAIVDLERDIPAPPVLPTNSEEPMTDTQKEAAGQWISKAWLKDHLRQSYSTNFRANSTPPLSPTDDGFLDGLLKSVPRVKNPVPDLAYGVEEDAFSPRDRKILDVLGCELSSEVYHVFSLVEAKSMNNPLGEAENQCCRGGVAMTYNKRSFDAAVVPTNDQSQQFTPSTFAAASSKSTLGTYPRADMESFTFSLAIDPDHANLFVHWAEETAPQTTIWHMNCLEPYDFRLPNDYRRLHHDVDKILDWGVGERLQGIKRQLGQIRERLETEKNKKRKIAQS